jgi:hypothetical protein
MDQDFRENELVRAAKELHARLQLCFDTDRECCAVQEFADIADSLLGEDTSCGMSNLRGLAASVRRFEKAIIAIYYES